MKNKNILIIFSIIMLFFTGCFRNDSIVIKSNTKEKVDYINSNEMKPDYNFFEKEDERMYRLYSEKLIANSKIRIVNSEPINSTTLIPAMYINVDSFAELKSVLDEVADIYTIVFDEDSQKYLDQFIKKETIIDMAKRNFTFDELMKKVAYSYDIYFTRTNNTYKFKLYKEKKYNIPPNIDFNGKDVKKNEINYSYIIQQNIKSLMSNKNEDAFIYDTITGNLYIKDKINVLERIDNYFKDLKQLEKIDFEAEITILTYSTEDKDNINWSVLYNYIEELNIKFQDKFKKISDNDIVSKTFQDDMIAFEDKYTFENGDIVRDKIIEYINEIGFVEKQRKYNLKSVNNNKMTIELKKDEEYISKYTKDGVINSFGIVEEKINNVELKNFDTFFNLELLPIFDKETHNVHLNFKLSLKKLQELKENKLANNVVINTPVIVEKKINNVYVIPNNSYVILNLNKTQLEDIDSNNINKEDYLVLIKFKTKLNNQYIK